MTFNLRRRALRGLAVLACASCFSSVLFAQSAQTTTLRVSAIPDEAPTELQRKFTPLGKYLEQELGMPVSFVAVTDYAGVVEALGAKRLDLVWLGGFTFIQAKMRTGGTAIPLVQRTEDEKFTSRFITADPTIKTLADLKGKTFVFGAPSSTSGHLMPRYFLGKAGISPDKDFKTVAFSGAHDATVAFVQSGRADAGVLNASVWDKLVETGKVDTSKVRVFYVTPPYFDYNWTVRGDLDPVIVKKLRDAFLKLDPANPHHKEILDLQRASKFITTKAENYVGIETAGKAGGLLD